VGVAAIESIAGFINDADADADADVDVDVDAADGDGDGDGTSVVIGVVIGVANERDAADDGS